MIHEHRAPGALRQQRRGDRRVGRDAHARAPAHQPACDQRALDRRCRDDHDVHAAEFGRDERRVELRFLRAGRRRQRQRDAEGRAGAGDALDRNAAAHALDDAPGNRQAKPGAAELAGDAAIGLLELLEDAVVLVGCDADAGVAHQNVDLAGPHAGLDDDRDAAAIRELHGVAGEIEQHLSQPRGVADHVARQRIVDIGSDLELLRLRTGGNELDRLLHQCRKIEGARVEVDAAGFDLGEIEDLVDQRKQRVA